MDVYEQRRDSRADRCLSEARSNHFRILRDGVLDGPKAPVDAIDIHIIPTLPSLAGIVFDASIWVCLLENRVIVVFHPLQVQDYVLLPVQGLIEVKTTTDILDSLPHQSH